MSGTRRPSTGGVQRIEQISNRVLFPSCQPPVHGTLSLNADGSFSYVHNGSETVSDSFTYRVSDGINVLNLATVSLTITPTNDAPVTAAIAPQTVEQGRTLTVNVIATDPDDSTIAPESNTLTYRLAPNAPSGASIDPVSGVLTWTVPRTQTVGLYTIAVQVPDAGTPALSASRSVTVEVLNCQIWRRRSIRSGRRR